MKKYHYYHNNAMSVQFTDYGTDLLDILRRRTVKQTMDAQRRAKRILVVESEMLLSQGLISLLRSRPGLEVKGVYYAGLNQLVSEIETFLPDVILIRQQCLAEYFRELLPVLMIHPEIRLVSFSPETNYLHVYVRQEVQVKESADFFASL